MDFHVLTLLYGAVFGKGDGSDMIEWEIELNDEQSTVYRKAVMTATPIEDIPELQEIINEAYEEIKEQETGNFIDYDDDYTRECMGLNEVDADNINNLVHAGDKHAIEFFSLKNLSKDELEKWDAHNLSKLPRVVDFDENFQPHSPFEMGWELIVNPPDTSEIELEDSEIDEYLKELFESNDIDLAEEVICEQESNYCGDLPERAMELAATAGCNEYVEKHKND